MTLLPVPAFATATKIPSEGDQVTEFQLFASIAEARLVQVIPSGEVMTLLPAPAVAEVATKSASVGDHAILDHTKSAADPRAVQLIPSGEVIMRLLVPLEAPATKSPVPPDPFGALAAHTTLFQLFSPVSPAAVVSPEIHVCPTAAKVRVGNSAKIESEKIIPKRTAIRLAEMVVRLCMLTIIAVKRARHNSLYSI
jgi:hypothetical protein